jgi:hypothetical protein
MSWYLGFASWLVLLLILPASGQDQPAPLKPITVCEVIENLKEYDGHAVAVLGRFSFRTDGRWISEDECYTAAGSEHQTQPATLWLSYAPQTAPRITGGYQLDGALIAEKLQLIKKHTSLKQFRFGTPDYDRWAVVYGEIRVDNKPVSRARRDAPAELFFAGDGYVMFLRDATPPRSAAR